MPSIKRVEPIDFETAVPTTADDVAALARARELSYQMDSYEYLEFLLTFTKDVPSSREIDGPWPEPFEL
jgi:hypothetical protein